MNRQINLGSLAQAQGPFAERIAFIDQGDQARRWSFRELDSAADAIAHRLTADGYPPGARVALVAANSGAFLAAYLGIMRAGHVVVPVNYRLPRETVGYILQDSAAALVLAEPGFAGLLDGVEWTELGAYVSEARVMQVEEFVPRQPENDVAEILYTSGSTGRPKGVVLTHAGQIWALDTLVGSEPLTDERTLIAAPLYHMNGLVFSAIALKCAAQFVLMPRFEARSFIEAVAEHRCTLISGIPTMLAMVAQHTDLLEKLDLTCVRGVSIGSAPLTEGLLKRVNSMFPNALVSNGYGTTEVGPAIFGAHPLGLARPAMSVGYPLQGVECRLVGGVTAERGVLEVKSPAAFREYLN